MNFTIHSHVILVMNIDLQKTDPTTTPTMWLVILGTPNIVSCGCTLLYGHMQKLIHKFHTLLRLDC